MDAATQRVEERRPVHHRCEQQADRRKGTGHRRDQGPLHRSEPRQASTRVGPHGPGPRSQLAERSPEHADHQRLVHEPDGEHDAVQYQHTISRDVVTGAVTRQHGAEGHRGEHDELVDDGPADAAPVRGEHETGR